MCRRAGWGLRQFANKCPLQWNNEKNTSGASPGHLKNELQPPLFPLSWVTLYRVQPALLNSIYWPCLSYLVAKTAFLGLKSSG